MVQPRGRPGASLSQRSWVAITVLMAACLVLASFGLLSVARPFLGRCRTGHALGRIAVLVTSTATARQRSRPLAAPTPSPSAHSLTHAHARTHSSPPHAAGPLRGQSERRNRAGRLRQPLRSEARSRHQPEHLVVQELQRPRRRHLPRCRRDVEGREVSVGRHGCQDMHAVLAWGPGPAAGSSRLWAANAIGVQGRRGPIGHPQRQRRRDLVSPLHREVHSAVGRLLPGHRRGPLPEQPQLRGRLPGLQLASQLQGDRHQRHRHARRHELGPHGSARHRPARVSVRLEIRQPPGGGSGRSGLRLVLGKRHALLGQQRHVQPGVVRSTSGARATRRLASTSVPLSRPTRRYGRSTRSRHRARHSTPGVSPASPSPTAGSYGWP